MVITTYYLEMHSAAQIRGKPLPAELEVRECELKQYQFNRFLYQWVGAPWHWTDNLKWSDGQWQALIEQPNHRTWVAYVQGGIVGYYELLRRDDAVEILYFGLLERFCGQGWGGALLSHALHAAWAWPGTQRVWLHTCTVDHPHALANYQARGLQLYRQVEGEEQLD
ncbi:GNAT family N-acetyltransferase [Pseudomonas sp. 5P_3.1_Bac2]|uniref:GNAT family N-acetyltransferase n=1 Tax=Pseudomonas sp. 5P_3.1_Bac2 TaxID=2971617 RepID=UPI0021C87AFE|nr:GNAT family N-acetyltransferase [Pseudomonas sp. 5P_3.1_Bac2]MCU1719170.1 GNAT family N-acetyltransferase [Pseudomonas sp. 5P_3.1_Bac2]